MTTVTGQIVWREVKPGLWVSRAMETKTGRVYLGQPLPTKWMRRLCRPSHRVEPFKCGQEVRR